MPLHGDFSFFLPESEVRTTYILSQDKREKHKGNCVRGNCVSLILSSFCSKLPSSRATVVTDWESTKSHLCSKLSRFKMSWQMLEVQLQLSPLDSSLPYLRLFQWGTVWAYTSQDIKNKTSQSWKFNFY